MILAAWVCGVMFAQVAENDIGKENGIQELRPRAERGYPGAQTNLRISYATGEGVQRDEAEAVTWWWLAGKQGHDRAVMNLGVKRRERRIFQLIAGYYKIFSYMYPLLLLGLTMKERDARVTISSLFVSLSIVLLMTWGAIVPVCTWGWQTVRWLRDGVWPHVPAANIWLDRVDMTWVYSPQEWRGLAKLFATVSEWNLGAFSVGFAGIFFLVLMWYIAWASEISESLSGHPAYQVASELLLLSPLAYVYLISVNWCSGFLGDIPAQFLMSLSMQAGV